MSELPAPYARALELVAAGATDDDVAAELDIEPAAVPVLLEIARTKARRALATETDPGPLAN